jgi:hypothetical protein
LWDVSSSSPSDVWASGYYEIGQQEYSLMEHYNGRTWRQIAAPSNGSGVGAVLDLGLKDVWALDGSTLLEYNGLAWSAAASQPSYPDTLIGTSSNDVWTIVGGGSGGVAEPSNPNI